MMSVSWCPRLNEERQHQCPYYIMSKPTVKTRFGEVRGNIEKSSEGDDYYSFKGIPYAKPPIGLLRFTDPEPPETWDGIKDATDYGLGCAQFSLFKNAVEGSDDCLYLNVYTKEVMKAPRPVMVYFYGGAFVFGESSDEFHGPDYFMRKDIVLVTINYRVGILGFLNLEDEIAPGNQGLKDQVLALKWIQDNIRNFGGDSKNVTIFGLSAGGASVHYLTLSSMAEGLFHKAIIQSGVVLNPWTHFTTEPKKFAYKLCELLGNKTRDHEEIIRYLRTVDIKKLIEAQQNVTTVEDKIKFMFPFAPGIDAKSKNPIMPTHPSLAAKKGIRVPLLIGFASREGLFFHEYIKGHYDKFQSDFENCLHSNVKELLERYNLSFQDLKDFYFKNNEKVVEKDERVLDLLGDLHFIEGIHQILGIQTEKSSTPTYVYRYTQENEQAFVRVLFNLDFKGASHGDELGNLFRMKFLEKSFGTLKKNPIHHKMMEIMIELWVNFASTGTPTPVTSELIPVHWEPLNDGKDLLCLNICENLRMEVVPSLAHKFSTISKSKQI